MKRVRGFVLRIERAMPREAVIRGLGALILLLLVLSSKSVHVERYQVNEEDASDLSDAKERWRSRSCHAINLVGQNMPRLETMRTSHLFHRQHIHNVIYSSDVKGHTAVNTLADCNYAFSTVSAIQAFILVRSCDSLSGASRTLCDFRLMHDRRFTRSYISLGNKI